jgi:hypothetical protein
LRETGQSGNRNRDEKDSDEPDDVFDLSSLRGSETAGAPILQRVPVSAKSNL